MSDIKRILLAYSGGLDTSVILTWLIETYGTEVVAWCGNVGQGEDLDAVRKKALDTGAADCLVSDLREEFVRDFCYFAIQSGAVYEGSYLLGTSLARPVLAKEMVRVARECGADALSHGCTGKGNDQLRFELAFQALAPELKIIAPWREWDLRGRTELLSYADKFDIPVEASLEKPYSIDRNLFHISYEGGILEDPWRAPDEEMFEWTQSPLDAPDVPTELEIDFESGRPVIIAAPQAPETLGRNVVIAWNRATETARTVAVAMPLLKHAERVTVLTVEGGTVPGPSGVQVAEHLVRNGIHANAITVGQDGCLVGEAILAEAGVIGADLLIKGAYTRTRLRQMIFGGATRHILSHATIPVLMAH